MATERTLELRRIQPRLRPSGHTPNPLRREAKAGAKAQRISVRRWKRQRAHA